MGLSATLRLLYLEQKFAPMIHRQCAVAYDGLTSHLPRVINSQGRTTIFIGFYCNAGEHRSVAMAEVFKRVLVSLEFEREISHISEPLWRPTHASAATGAASLRSHMA